MHRSRLSPAPVLHRALFAAALLSAGLASGLAAQDSLLAELAHRFRSKPLSVGALFQVIGDVQPRDRQGSTNGFRVTNFRLKLSGELDGGFGYLLQTNFASSPAILDAEAHYRVAEPLVLQAGQFKAPFSREFLAGAGDLDFIDRARVVAALAPGRQLGVMAGGRAGHGRVEYAAGAFNGNGTGAGGNDGNNLLGVARVGWWPLGTDAARGRLGIAASAGYSQDTRVNLGSLVTGFQGERTLWGIDARFESGRWLLAGEVIGARLAPAGGGSRTDPRGWQLTGATKLTPRVQLLLRWDALRPDGLAPDSDLLVVGLRAWPTGAVQLRLNDLVDLTDASPGHHRVLAGAQLGF